jgi:hypothetical protein
MFNWLIPAVPPRYGDSVLRQDKVNQQKNGNLLIYSKFKLKVIYKKSTY